MQPQTALCCTVLCCVCGLWGAVLCGLCAALCAALGRGRPQPARAAPLGASVGPLDGHRRHATLQARRESEEVASRRLQGLARAAAALLRLPVDRHGRPGELSTLWTSAPGDLPAARDLLVPFEQSGTGGPSVRCICTRTHAYIPTYTSLKN